MAKKRRNLSPRIWGCWNAALQQQAADRGVYARQVDVKYRVWKAEEKIDNAVVRKLL